MIKLILIFLFVDGIFGNPFLLSRNDDGNAENDDENAGELLPGTRNLGERRQVEEFLPGVRNLDEKSIPDTITLRRIPIPSSELEDELPIYIYDGSFLTGVPSSSRVVNDVKTEVRIKEESGNDDEQSAGYPAAVEKKEEEPKEAYHYPPASEKEIEKSKPEPEVKLDQAYYYPPAVTVTEKLEEVTPYPPSRKDLPDVQGYYYYAPPAVVAQGEEIKGTDIKEAENDKPSEESSNTPLEVPSPFGPNPKEFTTNQGEESLGTSISPSENVPETNKDQVNIPPSTSVKVQDSRGQYAHGFSNPDGTQVQESGHLISTDNGWEYVIAKEGSYSYLSPEGIPINVRYIADHLGFRILSQSFAGR